MTVNIEAMQDTLNRLTEKIDRWRQSTWSWVPDGVDPITDEDAAKGTYHDFELSQEFFEWYNSEEAAPRKEWGDLFLPIADCGTSFCVAGDVCVANGYTFVAPIGEKYAGQVVKTKELETALRDPDGIRERDHGADVVAQEILGLTYSEASVLFHQTRSLPEIWGIGYAITGGQLRLPETLPESTRRDGFGDSVLVSGTTNAIETRRAIFNALRSVGETNADWRHLARRELDKLSTVEA